LAVKLTAAFLLVALTVALLVAIVLRLTSAEQLDRLIIEQQRGEFSETLASYYAETGSWAGLRDFLYPNDGGHHGPGGGGGNGGPGPYRRDWRALFGLADANGLVLIPVGFGGQPAGTRLTATELAEGEPIEVDGEVVGTILTVETPPGLNPEEQAYLRRTNQALLWAAGGAVLVALVVGVVLARTLTHPLQALTQATHRMASGQLEQEVPAGSPDEIGELARAFNQMSRQVARANNARRQMTADVAHELRTPLTVIAGYVEAMRDGMLSPTPERLTVIYSELEHLQRLVGDLRLLSQADAGELKLNRQPMSLEELLRQAARAFEHQAAQKKVKLALEIDGRLPTLEADETRLAQVMSNLLANALRYTPGGGKVSVRAGNGGTGGNRGTEALSGTPRSQVTPRDKPEMVFVEVADTGVGIAAEDMPFVFDRFYRADKARSEEGAESGLGLAIVKALVEAHGGTIAVEPAMGGGTIFRLSLPVSMSEEKEQDAN
jgi:signal transduction histidine kinase